METNDKKSFVENKLEGLKRNKKKILIGVAAFAGGILTAVGLGGLYRHANDTMTVFADEETNRVYAVPSDEEENYYVAEVDDDQMETVKEVLAED